MPLLIKLAPYLAVVGLLVGVFFYGVSVGKTKAEVKYQKIYIEAGQQDVEVERRQSEVLNNRNSIDIITILYEGSF